MSRVFRRSLSILLCVLLTLPFWGGFAAAAITDDDPQIGRAQASLSSSSFFTEQGYTDETYEHEARFLSGYEIVDVIDVSKHQGAINWNKVYAAGIRNVMIRAGYRGYTEGELFTDEHFAENVEGAIAAGLNVGVYFFTQAITEAEAIYEASYVLSIIRNYKITLPIAYDCEYAAATGGGYTGRFYEAHLSKEAITANCIAFANTIRSGGYKPMIYANPYMFSTAIYPEQISQNCMIWLAAYRQKANVDFDFVMWQYSSKGHVDGINGNVDLSFWYIGTANAADADVLDIVSGTDSLQVEGKTTYSAAAKLPTLDKIFNSYTVSGVTWSSSDESVLTIDAAGNAVGITAGTAKITAKITVTANVNGVATVYTYQDSKDITVSTQSASFFNLLFNLFSMFVKLITELIAVLTKVGA